jgi:hypothetical protein
MDGRSDRIYSVSCVLQVPPVALMSNTVTKVELDSPSF